MEKPWLEFYDEGVPASLDYPDLSISQLFDNAAEEYADKIAVIFGGIVGGLLLEAAFTYEEIRTAVNRFALVLQQFNVQKGDRVAIYLPNCPQFIIAYYAILQVGGIVVPCNPLFVARELHHQIIDSGAKVLLALTGFHKIVTQARPETPLEHVIYTNIKEYFPCILKTLFTLAAEKKKGHRIDIIGEANTYWLQEQLAQVSGKPNPVKVSSDDTAILMYTGGTTGIPKAAELSHRNLVCNAVMASHWVQAAKGREVILTALPLFHSYGMTTCMNVGVFTGAQLVLIPNPRETIHVLKAIQKHRVTLFPGVPTMYVAINNFPQVRKYNLRSVRACISGAAPLPVEVQEKFQELTGAKLVEGYGLSESSPVTHANPIGRNRVGTIGVAWPDTDAKIVDVETGKKEQPVGEIGELVIRGPQVMKGYWNMPDETAATLRNGWLHTGDIAKINEEGYFQIVDRKKDMIISGGFNIYPRDIEEVIYEHPAVKEVAAAGIPNEYSGEIAKVYIVIKEGASLSEDEIIAFCKERLAKFKVPKAVEFRSELPKTMVGKILRRALVEEEIKKQQKQPIWVDRSKSAV